MEKLNLKVEGMSCGGCVRQLQKALAAVPGVRVCDVNVGSATVELDSPTASKEAVLVAVQRAGFEATTTE